MNQSYIIAIPDTSSSEMEYVLFNVSFGGVSLYNLAEKCYMQICL